MHVGVFGINFKTAQLALHEAVARDAQALIAMRSTLPWVLLSTCNRTEIYFGGEDIEAVQKELNSYFKGSTGVYALRGQDCFIHLCRVIAGLDSAALLETDITRQVKGAYAQASARASLPSSLHYLFQKSLKIAKSAKNISPSQMKGSTLLNTLWRLAEQEFECLQKKKILLVGYSKTHRSFACFLQHRGIQDFVFCSKDPSQVTGYSAVDRTELSHWNRYDWISCASKSDHFLIRGEGSKKHLVFDLGVPRNVDPSIETADVKLWNMEQINIQMQLQRNTWEGSLDRMESHILESVERLKLGVPRISWEGDYVSDVFHTGCK